VGPVAPTAVMAEELLALDRLQEELSRLKQDNERLHGENKELKHATRNENFSMDTKIAAVAVGKVSIQNLEKEKEFLRLEKEKLDRQIKHFKLEKATIVESLLALSSEVNGILLVEPDISMF